MTREETFSLLVPRYLRGELNAAETADFQIYLKSNPDFQSDIDFQRNLMAARPNETEVTKDEFGWARLSRSIDALEADESEDKTPMTKSENRRSSPIFWRAAAVALVCVSIGQALYISQSGSAKNYQLASKNVTAGTTLQIAFAADTDFNDISEFLTTHHGQIISGPSKLGILTLSFSDEENCETAIKAIKLKEQFVETYTSCDTVS